MKLFGFNIEKENLDKLEQLVKAGISFGLDLKDILTKIDNLRKTMSDDIVRIAFLGGFSVGKTSIIAGLLGNVDESMKIDSDESTDKLEKYPFLKEGFEIVDTPGLFGTKDIEENGELKKLSEITKKYISEAHIIIYVCDSVVPIKDSQITLVKWVLRDLNKLDSTIFVINKMDDEYDMDDEEDYKEGVDIAKKNLISSLKRVGLTPEEENRLKIVCISADPFAEGLSYWSQKESEYLKKSHIESLRREISNVINENEAFNLKIRATKASINDMVKSADNVADSNLVIIKNSLPKVESVNEDINLEKQNLSSKIDASYNSLIADFDSYRRNLLQEIYSATAQSLDEIIVNRIGVSDGNLTFNIFERDINNIISGAAEQVNSIINSSVISFNTSFNTLPTFVKESIHAGTEYIKGINVTNKQIITFRDKYLTGLRKKNEKINEALNFKGKKAVKYAKQINKGLGIVAGGIDLGLEAFDWLRQLKNSKDFDEIKGTITNVLEDSFDTIDNILKNRQDYLEIFVPQYKELEEKLQKSEEQVSSLKQRIRELEEYSKQVKAFIEAEDTEYSELK